MIPKIRFFTCCLLLVLFLSSLSCHKESLLPDVKAFPSHPFTGLPLSSDFVFTPVSGLFSLHPALTRADLLFQIPGGKDFLYYALWADIGDVPTDLPAQPFHKAAEILSDSLQVPYEEESEPKPLCSSRPRFSFYPPDYEGSLKEEGALLPLEENAPAFLYDPESKTYSRCDMPGFSWTNVFLLETDITYAPDGTVCFPTEGGTGFYMSRDSHREIRWQTYPEEGRLALRDENGEALFLFPGNSFFMLIPYNLYG